MESALPWYAAWAGVDAGFPAVVRGSGTLSYGDLLGRIEDAAGNLRGAGVRAGARVIVDVAGGGQWADSGQWIVAVLAVIAAGGQAILPDGDWPAVRRRHVLAAIDPEFTLTAGKNGALEILRTQQTPRSPAAGAKGDADTDTKAGVVLFTSGTTSTPIAYVRSAALLQAMVARVRARWPSRLSGSRPLVLSTAPLSHGFGLMNALLLTHAIGGTLIEGYGAEPAATARRIAEDGVRVLFSWPAHLARLADKTLWGKPGESGLEWCVSSSYRLEPEVANRFADCSGCTVRSQYGMTETGPLCLDGSDEPSELPFCVGPPLSGVEADVVDDADRPLAQGRQGRLRVRVDGVTPRSASGAQSFWHTGDIARMDDLGRVFVLGRANAFTDERQELYA